MFDVSVLTLVVVYVSGFAAFALAGRRIEISFFWLSAAIFFLYIAPKFVAYFLTGDDVFLPGSAILDRASSNAATVCIVAFMATILVCYAVSQTAWPERPAIGVVRRAVDPDRAVSVAMWVFVPLFAVAFYSYCVVSEVTLDNLLSKRELIRDGERTFAWVLQKIAQLVKGGLYLVLLATLVTRDARYSRHILILAALSCLVFIVSSQRSGLLILALEIALVLQVAGIMKLRYYMYLAAAFAALNIAILSSRALDTAQQLNWSDLIYRRYFFDLEKIAALIEYFVSDPLYRFDSFGILASGANGVRPDYGSHFYLAEQVFGTAGGVPPSILGEMIIYAGPVAIVPLTILLTGALIRCERAMRATSSPVVQLILVIVLSKLYFLTLNSDTVSSLNRMALDLVLFAAGLAAYALSGGRIARGADEPLSV